MAQPASRLAPSEEQLPLPLGVLMTGVLIQTRSRMDARKAEEARLWAGYCEKGTKWLIANTEPC